MRDVAFVSLMRKVPIIAALLAFAMSQPNVSNAVENPMFDDGSPASLLVFSYLHAYAAAPIVFRRHGNTKFQVSS
jgi:hypothetical protein